MSRADRSPVPAHAAPDAGAAGRRGRRGMLRGWRPALLIAGRTAWRHRGRTALIVTLIALPVLAMSFIAVFFRTVELPADERATRLMGAADAFATVHAFDQVDPPDPRYPNSTSYGAATERDPADVDLAALLPGGSQLAPAPNPFGAGVTLAANDALVRAGLVVDGLGAPLTAGMYRLVEGAAPAAPDEVAVNPQVAERLGVGIGDEVTLSLGDGATVVGLAVNPDCLVCDTVWAAEPLTEQGDTQPASLSGEAQFLVDLPPGADPHALWLSLADEGVSFLPRAAILDPGAYRPVVDYGGPADLATVGAVALVAGFGLLEVVLLAGTAFAVGTRRQIRELGWVAANGGTRRDVRRVVLAQGVVLGTAAAVAGLGLGIAAVLVGRPWLETLSGKLFAGLVLRPAELVGVAAFGLLAGVLAALVPARAAARVPVMDALTGSYTPPARPLRRPLLGLAVMVTGVALAFGAGIRLRALDAAYQRFFEQTDTGGVVALSTSLPPPPPTTAYTAVILAGITLAVLGLLVTLPAIVALASRLASRLPLVPRLALRDAGRHRHRTAPAIGAIMLVVGGTVALGFTLSGDHEKNRAGYVPSLPYGYATLYTGQAITSNEEAKELAAETAAQTIGATETLPVGLPGVPAETLPGYDVGETYVEPVQLALCGEDFTDDCFPSSSVIVGDAALVAALTGSALPDAASDALAGGEVVVLDDEPASMPPGEARLGTNAAFDKAHGFDDYEATDPALTTIWELPITVLEAPDMTLVDAVISPETAADLGLTIQSDRTLLVTEQAPTQEAEDRARAALEPYAMYLQVERGFQSDLLPIIAVLGGASALVTIGGVAIAVGLAAAEGRADLATLGAIGAAPRRRRLLAMAQAGVVGVLGCGLGVALGTFVAAVAYQGFTIGIWVVPWALLALIGFAVPAVAVLVAGVFTRSRLPMVRRVA